MAQDRKEQLKAAAAAYFKALAEKDFQLIPYAEDVVLRAPLAPGGVQNPLRGRENLRTTWWAPLPGVLGEVKVFDFYFNADLTAVVGGPRSRSGAARPRGCGSRTASR